VAPSRSRVVARNTAGAVSCFLEPLDEPDAYQSLRKGIGPREAVHGYPRPTVEAASRFLVPDTAEAGAQLVGGEDMEPQQPVVRRVPGHGGECGERQSGQPVLSTPAGRGVNERCSDSATSVAWMDRYLLDVRVAVNDAHQEVPDRPVGLVSCDPGPSVLLVSHQLGQAGWLVIGYRGHADRPEDGTRGALQLDERGQVAAAGKPDHT
jgi:hypothetical protein